MSKASEEAQKQLDRIVALGYPDVADMSAAAFRALARPLIRALEDSDLGTHLRLPLRHGPQAGARVPGRGRHGHRYARLRSAFGRGLRF